MGVQPVIRGSIQTMIIVPYDPAAPGKAPIAEVILRGQYRLRRRVVDFTYDLHLMHAGGSAHERALSLGEAESWVNVHEYRTISGHLGHWIERYLGTYDWPSDDWLATRAFVPYAEIRGAQMSTVPQEVVVAKVPE